MDEQDKDKIVIDFRHQTSEEGWQLISTRFWFALVPKWFQCLSWVGLIGGLQYLYDKNHNTILGIVISASLIFLWWYFFSFFSRVEFRGFLGVKSTRVTFFLSNLLSTFMAYSLYWFAQKAVEILKNKP